MVTIVFVRSIAHMNVAIDGINNFLAYRRFCHSLECDDEILAIWVRPVLDAGLPHWLRVQPDTSTEQPEPNVDVCSTEIGILHSVSLSGVWACCWLEGPSLRSARTPAEQREKILRLLISPVRSFEIASEHEAFFPVFDVDASTASVETEIRALVDRHHGVVASRAFRYDKAFGLIGDQTPLGE